MLRINLRREIKAFEKGHDSCVIVNEKKTIHYPIDDEEEMIITTDLTSDCNWIYQLKFRRLKHWLFKDGTIAISYTMNKLLASWFGLPKDEFIPYKFWPNFRSIFILSHQSPDPVEFSYRSFNVLFDSTHAPAIKIVSPYPRLDLVRWKGSQIDDGILCFAVDILLVELREPNVLQTIDINLVIIMNDRPASTNLPITLSTSIHPLLIKTRQSRIYAVPLNEQSYSRKDVKNYVRHLFRWAKSDRNNPCPAACLSLNTRIMLDSDLFTNGIRVYLFRLAL